MGTLGCVGRVNGEGKRTSKVTHCSGQLELSPLWALEEPVCAACFPVTLWEEARLIIMGNVGKERKDTIPGSFRREN